MAKPQTSKDGGPSRQRQRNGNGKSSKRGAPKTVAFEYIKGNHFRVIHADGAIGSITPHGNVHIAFYSERPAIPQMTVHTVDARGRIDHVPIPEQTVGKKSIIRELDVDVVIERDAIDGLIRWLQAQKDALNKKTEGDAS